MFFVANLLLFPAVKEFWKSVKNWESHRHEFGVLRFLGHSVYSHSVRWIDASRFPPGL